MPRRMLILLVISILSVCVPTITHAKNDKGKSNAGGQAAEHRSERAAEQSNAQWQEDSQKDENKKPEKDKKDKADKGNEEDEGNKKGEGKQKKD